MRTIILLLLVSANVFAQTIWAPEKAYWKYENSSFGSSSVIEIAEIDSMVTGTNIKVLRQTNTTTSYLGSGGTTVSTYYIFTYSDGEKVYLGSSVPDLKLFYDFGALRFQKAGDYDVDSNYTIPLSCTTIKGYKATKMGTCTHTMLSYGKCYERLGNLYGMFFPWINDCTASESYTSLVQYDDASGFHYLNGQFFCTTPNGIADETNKVSFSMGPNPCPSKTVISTPSPENLDYEVLNTEGIVVLNGTFAQRIELELPKSGLYLVRIKKDKLVLYSSSLLVN